jgi:hypothetical protein
LHFEVNGNGTNIFSPTTAELLASARRVDYMQPFDIAWEAMEPREVRETANMTVVHAFQTRGKDVGGAELQLWRRRYAHLGLEALKRQQAAVEGMSSSLGGACDCEAWIKGKHARLSFQPVTPMKLFRG